MGDTMMRFSKVISRKVIGENKVLFTVQSFLRYQSKGAAKGIFAAWV
jgi:hypothetical protein